MNVLVLLAIFVGIVFLIGNVVETRAHKSPKEPLEDLRVAYAPNLVQVFQDQEKYEREKDGQYRQMKLAQEKERWVRYNRELQDAKIKRWLEGNPVTDENPLTKREHPTPPQYFMGSFY